MVKHSQTIRRLLQTNFLSVFDHCDGLALRGLNWKITCGISRVTLGPRMLTSSPWGSTKIKLPKIWEKLVPVKRIFRSEIIQKLYLNKILFQRYGQSAYVQNTDQQFTNQPQKSNEINTTTQLQLQNWPTKS